MRKKVLYFILALWIPCAAQEKTVMFCEKANDLITFINKNHYNPKPIDDAFYNGVFSNIIEILDNNKRILTQEDIAHLKKFKKQFALTKSSNCNFLAEFKQTYKLALLKRINYLKQLKTKPLVTKNDTLYYKPKTDFNYFKNTKSLNNYWRKRVQLYSYINAVATDSVFSKVKNYYNTNKLSLKTTVIDKELCSLQKLEDNLTQNTPIETAFFNAILQYNDPNSAFFSASKKEGFESSLATSSKSFGVITSQDENKVFVDAILTGSPAFKNQKIKEGDEIIRLKSGSDILDIKCIAHEVVERFLNNEKHNEVEFSIKKKSGELKIVSLTKELLKTSNDLVSIFRLGSNIAYIKIASFYTGLESYNRLGLANDIAKHLYQLKRRKLEGLVIDLRYNGGGSMKEAIELAGMFIDRGPLSIIKDKDQSTITIKDPQRGSLFNGPIVILVNQFSASASEFFTSAMQDYNKAIVIGAPTFGKASTQEILPFHNDYIKITRDKFYRVTGKSIQSKGIIPDIYLPSVIDIYPYAEKHRNFALKNDNVSVKLPHIPTANFPRENLIEKSITRTNASSWFNAQNKKIKQLQNNLLKHESVPLNLKTIFKREKNYHKMFFPIASNTNLIVSNTNATKMFLLFNEDEKETNSILLKQIKDDAYINEAYHIINDYISLKNK